MDLKGILRFLVDYTLSIDPRAILDKCDKYHAQDSYLLIVLYGPLYDDGDILNLDFILKIKFRDKTSTHVPYIILEYAACFAFIFNTITINELLGWIVSICFWVMLVTLIYLIITKKKKEKKH